MRAVGVVGAVEDRASGSRWTHLEPARGCGRRRTPRPRGRRRAAGRRTPRRRRARRRRSRPGGRRAARGTRRRSCAPGRAEVEQPAADGEPVARCSAKSTSRRHIVGGRAWPSNTSASDGSVSPSTKVEPSFTMPAFSSAMRRRQSPWPSVWSCPTLVSTATMPSTTLVASQRPSSPTSTTAAATASSENQRNAAAVSSSK